MRPGRSENSTRTNERTAPPPSFKPSNRPHTPRIFTDRTGSGYIRKELLPKAVDELGKKGEGGSNPLLSEERWKEMDWDKNNCITFEEFVFSFHTWVMDDGGGAGA